MRLKLVRTVSSAPLSGWNRTASPTAASAPGPSSPSPTHSSRCCVAKLVPGSPSLVSSCAGRGGVWVQGGQLPSQKYKLVIIAGGEGRAGGAGMEVCGV